MRKRKYNPKRRIADSTDDASLKSISEKVRYTGNPAHKKSPNDYGLTPPTQPRMNRTLCDGTNIKLKTAKRLLSKGTKLGLVSTQERNGLPQNIWAVSPNGIALEAQLENAEQATYHGYPMGSGDPLANEVIARWKDDEPNE